ncbi:MAG TPA: hypothetical protein VK427_27030 [Kofleriaceae bacterium]|nr:hypothetical protein [Kofleriaceae bacterium]
MKIKKKNKHRHKFAHRNVAPRAPRATRGGDASDNERLGYTAAGAAGSALVGALLARQGWAPKTIAGTLAALGAGLAWKGDGATTKSLGAGTMSAAGAQFAMLMIDDQNAKKQQQSKSDTAVVKKPANADELPPGALEHAFERARERLALAGYDGAA